MKFLIVDEMHESIVPLLSSINVIGNYKPYLNREEVLNEVVDYDGIVVRSKLKLDVEFFKKAVQLKFIARAGAGLDQIDVEEVERRGIVIVNAPEGNRDALGEHALGLLLSLTNKISQGNLQVRNKIWDREGNRGVELSGKTVGLLGYGFMAQAFAKRLKAIGCIVVAYDKYKTGFSDEVVKEVSLNELKVISDVFSIHVPLTNETLGFVDEEFLKSFSKSFWLLNTARGPVLKLIGLIGAMKSGKVLGAGLDVLENEKINKLSVEEEVWFSELSRFENVVFSPHVGGWSVESYRRINTVLVEKLKTVIKPVG